MKKIGTVFAAVLYMLCLGGIYAWSMYVGPLKAEYGLSTAQTQLIFGCAIASLSFAMIIAGRIEKAKGPMITGVIGAVLYALGHTIVYFSQGKFAFIALGYSVFSGAGAGFGYLCALAVPVKWYPDKKGFITGLSVAGYGGGAIVLSNIIEYFLSQSVPVLTIFLYVGLFYGGVMFAVSFLYKNPPTYKVNVNTSIQVKEYLKKPAVLGLFFAMLLGNCAGLLVIGNLKPLGLDFGLSAKLTLVGIGSLAVGNFAGRVIWGKIYDVLKGKYVIIYSLSSLALGLLMLNMLGHISYFFYAACIIVGSAFGANFVIFASDMVNRYSLDVYGIVYPYVFTAYGFAAVIGPSIGGYLYDTTATYTSAVYVAMGLAICGVLVNFFVTPQLHKLEQNEAEEVALEA